MQVSILADCVGALLVYGALCSQGNQTGDINCDSLFPTGTPESSSDKVNFEGKHDKLSTCQRSESIDSTPLSHLLSLRGLKQFDFGVANFFCCGSPIGMILMKQYFESNSCKCFKSFSFDFGLKTVWNFKFWPNSTTWNHTTVIKHTTSVKLPHLGNLSKFLPIVHMKIYIPDWDLAI